MAIAGRKSEGAWGYGPNVRGPRSQRGDNTTAWEKLLPTFDFSFRAEGADCTPSSSSAVQSPPIRARSFFPFFPFIRTCQLRCRRRRRLHLASPSHRRYPVGATLKKASDKSFPLFFPFVFNGAGHLPSTQARCTPRGTPAPTPPPLARMQAALSPSLSPQPPPQCLYDRRHFPDPVALQPASPDFATQTGGAKGALAPTISARPPF